MGGRGSQGSFAAGAVAVVELRHGGASTRTQLAVGRRTRSGVLEAVARVDPARDKPTQQAQCSPPRAQTGVESHGDQQPAAATASLRRVPICSSPAIGGHSAVLARTPQPSSSFLFTLTPLAPAPAPAPAPACIRLHLACNCSHRKRRSRRQLQLPATSRVGAGSLELGGCTPSGRSHFLSFRPGQLLQATPAILSCVPSQLHLTNCFVSTRRPSSVHQTRGRHSPPAITISCRKGIWILAQWDCSPNVTRLHHNPDLASWHR